MSAARRPRRARVPATPALAIDDVVRDDPCAPGTYVTDGTRLLRLLGLRDLRRGWVAVEDCATLEVVLVHSSEVGSWGLMPVRRYDLAVAA